MFAEEPAGAAPGGAAARARAGMQLGVKRLNCHVNTATIHVKTRS